IAYRQGITADLVNPLHLASISPGRRLVMDNVDVLLARVELENVRILMQLVVQPDSVMIAADNPFHIGHFRLAVIAGSDQLPGALPFFRVRCRSRCDLVLLGCLLASCRPASTSDSWELAVKAGGR